MQGCTSIFICFVAAASAAASLSQVASPISQDDHHLLVSSTARFVQGTKTRRRSPSQNRVSSNDAAVVVVPHRRISSRQDMLLMETASPSSSALADFELTSVSPIQSSLGGLTGLQGLPPLSLIQFVKLLVAVTPFILPLIFVPLLLFTVGMFMIPVNKANNFFFDGDNNDGNLKRAAAARAAAGSVNSNWAKHALNTLVETDNCLELATCHLSQRVFTSGATTAVFSRDNVARLIRTYSNAYYPPAGRKNNNGKTDSSPSSEEEEERRISRRILRGLEVNDACSPSQPQLSCSPATLIQRLFFLST